jgi:hypothetical protein
MSTLRTLSILATVIVATGIAARPASADEPPGALQVGHVDRWYLLGTGELVPRRDVIVSDAGGEPIDLVDFYRAVGRSDLADEVSTRRVERGLLVGGGIAAAVAGTIWSAAAGEACVNQPLAPGATSRSCAVDLVPAAVGGGLLLVGVLGASAIDPNPLSEEDMVGLASRHNAALGAKAPSTLLVPYGSPDGGGLMLSGSF